MVQSGRRDGGMAGGWLDFLSPGPPQTANQLIHYYSLAHKKRNRSHGQRRGSSRGENEPSPRLERCRREEGVRERIDRGIQVSCACMSSRCHRYSCCPPARSPCDTSILSAGVENMYPKPHGYYAFVPPAAADALSWCGESSAVSCCDVIRSVFGGVWPCWANRHDEDHSIAGPTVLHCLTISHTCPNSCSSAKFLPKEFPRQPTRGQAE